MLFKAIEEAARGAAFLIVFAAQRFLNPPTEIGEGLTNFLTMIYRAGMPFLLSIAYLAAAILLARAALFRRGGILALLRLFRSDLLVRLGWLFFASNALAASVSLEQLVSLVQSVRSTAPLHAYVHGINMALMSQFNIVTTVMFLLASALGLWIGWLLVDAGRARALSSTAHEASA